MEKDKQEFLNNEILTLCIIAGLSRGYPVYKKTGTNETSKKEFKKILLQKLRECEQFYKVLEKNINFTQLDSIEDYKLVVEAAKKTSQKEKLSISQWELKLWNNRWIKAKP